MKWNVWWPRTQLEVGGVEVAGWLKLGAVLRLQVRLEASGVVETVGWQNLCAVTWHGVGGLALDILAVEYIVSGLDIAIIHAVVVSLSAAAVHALIRPQPSAFLGLECPWPWHLVRVVAVL